MDSGVGDPTSGCSLGQYIVVSMNVLCRIKLPRLLQTHGVSDGPLGSHVNR